MPDSLAGNTIEPAACGRKLTRTHPILTSRNVGPKNPADTTAKFRIKRTKTG